VDKERLQELVGNPAARAWADAFCELIKEQPEVAKDEETMLTWFSNAITTGWEAAMRRNAQNRQPQVIRCGWFAFEGFGLPYEGWAPRPGVHAGYATAGRALTYRRALRKARALAERFAEEPELAGKAAAVSMNIAGGTLP